ncbi:MULTISPECIES: polysaccharide deacetylase family protein [Arthrobacter]|uniref:Polysaccharide deacetylase family protein n=2 Tax=Arthrobacter TaxID=1663 RepID=A0ABU9KIV5_9MICC|nr:polysaccharide deacetylase family protein [Arthrobacter sp. YJM1]MDP5226126.1 polysaccharide deacetylase family protein [Arthrobacter sp. YJM1]
MIPPRHLRDSPATAGGPLSRRSLLIGGVSLAAAGLGLAACATVEQPAAQPPVPPTGEGAVVPASQPTSRPPAKPTGPSRPRFPSKSAILAEFSGRVPREWGLDVTGVALGSKSRSVALTFDACGGPGGSGFDRALIGSLRRHQVPATLFINKRWAVANPGLLRELAADPLFEIQNHGFHHLPLSASGRNAYGIPGTADLAAAYDEVAASQELLTDLLGHAPKAFRPGTAYYDDVTAAMVSRCGLLPANFSVNADAGATFPAETVAAQLAGVVGGDVVISHFNQPGSGTSGGYAAGLPRMLDRGIRFAHLSRVFSL